MFDVQNIYNSAPPSGPHKRGVQRPRRVILFDLKRPGAPRELTDHGNVPHPRMAPTSAPITTDVGNSQFFAKYGIRPIHDSTENMLDSSATTQACKMTRLYDDDIKFPKLEDCAHFHYDVVELGQIHVVLSNDNQENVYRPADANGLPEVSFFLSVRCNEMSWSVRRTFSDLCTFDKQLHRCIYDRNYSLLRELQPRADIGEDDIPELRKTMSLYLHRFSAIAGSMINCGPILSWLEMDNRGNRLIVTDDSAINTPAVAAAHAIRRYSAKALDEISFEVGDIISIIDMPPSEESSWWRGKRGFEVGFFPSDTVEVISEKVPQSVSCKIPLTKVKPVLRKRGKLISFLRTFFTSRPTRTTLKRTGIMKERVFGCDLGEHLLNTGHDVPLVLKSCAEVIEAEGIVDGIYRLSGVASNIQRLRNEFDEDRVPDLEAEVYQQDIHSVSSLVKMYFRELPNPLLTYQLYDKFAEAVQDEETKLAKLHDVIQQLPPPHYRTAEYLLRHLSAIAAHGVRTGMHCKNLAIVWAPNLLRSKELEQSCTTAALQGVGIQAIVTECLIAYVDVLFNSSLHAGSMDSTGRGRPKSLAISTPTRLLSLEEARERAMMIGVNRGSPKQKYIEVGGGSATLPAQYHTVIDLPNKKKRKKSPNSSTSGWRSLFNRSKAPPGRGRARNLSSDTSEVNKDIGAILDDDASKRRRLRSVRSCDSLLSAATTPVKHSAGQVIPRPVIDGASGAGVRSQSCDTSYDYELEYRDDSPLNDEGEVFTQPGSRQPYPSSVFSHDMSAVTVVMASDATTPKTNFMSELEEKLHSRSASIDSRSQWRSDHSHTDLVTSADEPDVSEQCHSLPENFALQSLPSPTPAPRSNLPSPSGGRPMSYDNMIYDVPKDLFARRLPGDGHVMRPSSAWAHENLGSPVGRDSIAAGGACVQERNPGGSSAQMPSDVQHGQMSQLDDDMHVSGVEGAVCELAHYEESLVDDIFHGNSAANTDSESEFERREAPSSSDDFSTDIFNCLKKRCREATKETLFKVQSDVDTPAEGATGHYAPAGDSGDVCVIDRAVSDSHSVDVTGDRLSPVTPTNTSEPLTVQERIADPTEYVTCVEVTGDVFETGDIIPCISDMSKSSDDNMTPASDMSKSLESMLEEAGGGSLYTLAETTESCASDNASVTLGAATSQHHDSSSSIDSEIRAAVQLHKDTLHSSPPGLDDTPRVLINVAASSTNEDSTVGLSDHHEAGMECHVAEIGRTSVGSECLSANATVGVTQEILDSYLYTGSSQIELSDNEVEYVDPWSRHDDAETTDQTQQDASLPLELMDQTQRDASSPFESTYQTQQDISSLFESTQQDASSPCESTQQDVSSLFESTHQTQRDVSSLCESTPQPDDVLPAAPSYYDLYVARSAPSVPAPSASPSPPAPLSPSAPLSPQAERGHIVIRRHMGQSPEGAVQQVQATRVTPAVRYSGATTPPLPSAWSAPPLPSPRHDITPTFPPSTTRDIIAVPAVECSAAVPECSADTYVKNRTFQSCDTFTTRSISPTISPAVETTQDKKPVDGSDPDCRQPIIKKHSLRSQIGSSRFGECTTDVDGSGSDNNEAHRRVTPEVSSSADEVESDEARFTMQAAKDEHTPSSGVKRKKSVRELLSQFEKGKSADDGTRQTVQKAEVKPCDTLHETDDQQRAPVVLVRPSGNVRANVDWSSVRVIDATKSCQDDDSMCVGEKSSRSSSPPRCARRSSLSFQQRFKQFESHESSSANARQLGDVACVASPRSSVEKEIGPVIGRGQSRNVSESPRSVEHRVETPLIDVVRPEPAPRSCRMSDRWRKPDGDKVRDSAKKSDSSLEEEELIVYKPTLCTSESSRRPVQPQPRNRESINTADISGSLSKSRSQLVPSSTEVVHPPGPKTIIIEEKKAPERKRISLLTEAERPKTLSERLQLFENGSSGGRRESQDKTGSGGEVGCGAHKGHKEDVSVSVRGLSEKFEQRASLRRSAHAGSTSSQDSDACGSPSGSVPNKRLLVGTVDLVKPCGVAL